MALDPLALASDIESAVGAPGPTPEITGMANAIVTYVKTGLVTFPGTIIGGSPDGSDATGLGGIGVFVPGGLVTQFLTIFPPTPQIIAKATAIETHLLTGVYSLGAGDITGACAGGAWTGGAMGGSVLGYTGSILAPLIAAAVVSTAGVTPEIQGLADAICDHITDNMQLLFAPGTITGACGTPAPTGPTGAVGVGGTIT